MRILIVSFVFPPYNIIGAVRVGKVAKYLTRFGHDVRVIAAANLDIAPTLSLEIPPENVVYTRWIDVDAPFRAIVRVKNIAGRLLARRRRQPIVNRQGATSSGGAVSSEGPQSAARTLGWRARLLYIDFFHFPDFAVGWTRPAVRAGRELVRNWKPEVILASGAPWTAFVVARDLAAYARVPWVADLRDLWSDNHTTFVSGWRMRTFDALYERRVLRTASALVTVSEPLAARLRARYSGKRVAVVMNGFDADDYRPDAVTTDARQGRISGGPQLRGSRSHTTLRLVYTGEVNRNMLPLLDGLELLGEDARAVQVEIVGHLNRDVRERYQALAEAHGVADRFTWLPSVPHAEAARLQQHADVLLLFIHATQDDAGVYTGKLFEYVGAGRPILVIGSTTGVAAALVCQRGLGVAAAAPNEVASRIREWIEEKRASGRIAAPIRRSVDDLSREAQTRLYAQLLIGVASA